MPFSLPPSPPTPPPAVITAAVVIATLALSTPGECWRWRGSARSLLLGCCSAAAAQPLRSWQWLGSTTGWRRHSADVGGSAGGAGSVGGVAVCACVMLAGTLRLLLLGCCYSVAAATRLPLLACCPAAEARLTVATYPFGRALARHGPPTRQPTHLAAATTTMVSPMWCALGRSASHARLARSTSSRGA